MSNFDVGPAYLEVNTDTSKFYRVTSRTFLDQFIRLPCLFDYLQDNIGMVRSVLLFYDEYYQYPDAEIISVAQIMSGPFKVGHIAKYLDYWWAVGGHEIDTMIYLREMLTEYLGNKHTQWLCISGPIIYGFPSRNMISRK